MATTNQALVRRVARKLLARTQAQLDDPGLMLSTADLGRLANVVKDAAAVLGVRCALDDEEQRAKIRVLIARAGEGGDKDRSLTVSFVGEAETAAL